MSEYPKALFKDDVCVVAVDADQEAELAADGFAATAAEPEPAPEPAKVSAKK